MVGVGVAEGGGGPAGGEPFYGEYLPYPPEFYVPPEMCANPQQHPPHAHMCTVHTEYGGMPAVVTSSAMMPQMMPAVMEDGRHYLVHAPHPPPPHPHHPHHQPPPHHQQPPPHHQQPPPHHHQQQHHYNQNGAGGPQHYYNAGFQPHFHVPPHHVQHYAPPAVYQKDERAQRQYSKLKQKHERKYNNRNNGTGEAHSGASTPSLSPRKELNGSSSGCGGSGGSGAASSGGSSSASAAASLHGDDDTDTQHLLDLLSATKKPHVSEMTSTTALVQWNSPLPEGVTLPRGELTYELLLGDRGRYKAIYSGAKLSCVVCDLRPGCEYSVCLQVRAGDVTGAASEAATFRAPAAPPARVAPPRVTQRTRSTLTLRWNAAADNGARITHYVLEMEAGAGWREVARPRTRHHTAADLPPSAAHRFRLAAVNECGRGEWSEEVVGWTCGAPPPAPAPPLLAAARADALALAWERRAPDHEYTLQADDETRPHGFLPIYSGPDDNHLYAPLRRATDYRFRLRCENADGQGPWSAEVTYRTLPERPGPPGRPTLKGKAHSRAFRLRWEPPAEDGGAAIETYTLELDDGEGFRAAYSGPEREAHCDRLRPGAAYRARVRCANVAGESEWATGDSVSTDVTVPGAPPPPELAATPRASSAHLRWRPPECTGGAELTEYRVELAEQGGAGSVRHAGPERECVLRDLAPGRAYSATVCACSRVGAGPPSAPLSFRTAPAPPDAPPAPDVTVLSARTARVAWLEPPDNGAPLIDYRLEVSAPNSSETFTEVFRGLALERLVGELVPYSAYLFRVCASNEAGRGAWSGVRSGVTPSAPPAAPLAPRWEAEARCLRVSWRAPSDHGAPLTRYRLRLDDAEIVTEGTETERALEGLEPDTTYRLRVAAESELGLGEWSECVKARTRPPPPAPPRLEAVQLTHNTMKLQWAPAPGAADLHYRLEMRGPESRDFRLAYRGSARYFKAKKLRESTTYAFRIRASEERGGCGGWGDTLEVSTCAAPPAAPRALVADTSSGRAVLQWEGGEEQYCVQVSRGGGAWGTAWVGAGSSCELAELEAGAEYSARVCGVRAGLAGAWSTCARVLVPSAPRSAPRAPRAARSPRTMHPRRAALLLAAGFLILAVLVAALLQRLVARP